MRQFSHIQTLGTPRCGRDDITREVARLAFALLLFPATLFAAALNDGAAVPHLDDAGREGYRVFLQQPMHRAFAIAPGGAWSWKADEASAAVAEDVALRACAEHTEQACMLYARDDQVVFDAKAWPKSWGPYKTGAEAARAGTGKRRGERFPDLAMRSPAGKPMRLSDLRGKVVVLHFWGTWCTPCRQEMPELQKLNQQLAGNKDVQLVLLQMREDSDTARQWAAKQNFRLPFHDSGVRDGGDTLSLGDGKPIRDRDLARVFPSTYVLDRHGVVVFSHTGPVADWLQYLPFLRDAAARSGK